MANDTKGKEVPHDDAIKLHHKLAMGMPAETGAGKGALGGKNPPKTSA